jgi:hypothetical protein
MHVLRVGPLARWCQSHAWHQLAGDTTTPTLRRMLGPQLARSVTAKQQDTHVAAFCAVATPAVHNMDVHRELIRRNRAQLGH